MPSSRFILLLFMALALVAFSAQFAIDFSVDNIASSSIVLASSLSILLYIMWTSAIQTHPLSTFAIFGFCMTTQWGALVAQSAYWTPLALHLRQPIETFATLAFYQGVALAAHAVYRQFTQGKHGKGPSLLVTALNRMGLYETPSAGTLWVMGIFGLMNLAIGGGDGVISKIAHGMSFLAWAPFLIPMYVLQQESQYCNTRRNYFFLGVYVLLIVAIGIAINARGIMLSGLVTVALFALLRCMRGNRPVGTFHVIRVVIGLIILSAVSIPVSYLVNAMSLARGVRAYGGPVKVIEETIYYLGKPELVREEQERQRHISIGSNYDETYFENPLITRLVETKFHDNALYFSSKFNEKEEDKLMDLTINLFWTALPDPMLKAMSVKVDKDDYRFSMGDYLSYVAGGGDLGSYKTGSHLGQGQAMFGILYPVIYFFLCIVLFMCVDLLVYRNAQGGILISALGMLGIWRMFQYGISAESLQYLFIAIVRGLPQNIALYLLVYYMARRISEFMVPLPNHSTSTSTALIAR